MVPGRAAAMSAGAAPRDEARRLPRRRDFVLATGLAAVALVAPLPFGGVIPTARAAISVAAFALAALAWLTLSDPRRLRRLLPGVLPLLLLTLFGLAQSIPWPIGFVDQLSPHGAEAYTGEAVRGGSRLAAVPLSVAPEASRRTALGLLSLVALGCAAALAGRWRRLRVLIGGGVVLAAIFQVLYGAPRALTGDPTIWDVSVPGEATRLRGTFVNPDHLATWLELSLALVFAWLWWSWHHARAEGSWDRRLLLIAPPAVAWVVLFGGLAFTGSRAGLVAAAAATLLQGLLLWRSGRPGFLPVAWLAVVAGAAVAGWIGLERAFGRLMATGAGDVGLSARLDVWEASLTLVRRFPWTGTGLGTFRDSFPTVQPAELAAYTWTHAHNDWLEVLVTGGVIGLALVLLTAAWLVRVLDRQLRTSRSSTDRAAALAALGAVAAVGLHALVDFGLTLPANAAALAIVLGASLGPLLRE